MEQIGKILAWILKLILLIVLSLFVVPAMFIMAGLHKTWEGMMGEVFHLNDF